MSKSLIDNLFELDNGETWKFYERTHAKKLRAAPIGTKLVPSVFAKEILINDNDTRPWKAKVAGHARASDQVRVHIIGKKHPETFWHGFWEVEEDN